MAASQPTQITALLHRLYNGETASWARLIDRTYPRLRSLIGGLIRSEFPASQEQPTEIAHELSLRLLKQRPQPWANRDHFFRSCAKLARLILLNRLRTQRHRAELLLHLPRVQEAQSPLHDLKEAVSRLGRLDSRQERIVSLIYFSGLNEAEAAERLNISERTVRRELASARLWLRSQLDPK